MDAIRKVELSDETDAQVVRIPVDLRLPGKEAAIRREGDRVILEVVKPVGPRAANPANQRLVDLLASWEQIDEEIGPIEDLPPDRVKL